MVNMSKLLLLLAVCLLGLGSAMASAKVSNDSPSLKNSLHLSEIEGSGASGGLDDEDYLDDYDEGSGWDDDEEEDYDEDEDELETVKQSSEIKVSLLPNKKSESEDIHFEDSNNDSSEEEDDDDLLYEYYNEDYNEEDYLDEIEEEKAEEEKTQIFEKPINEDSSFPSFFKLSYVYIMLASAIFSFTIVLLLFFLCRRSARERQEKRRQLAQKPFMVTSMANPRFDQGQAKLHSPIVKSYQRVPTSTQEFIRESTEKPLLN